MAEEFSQQMNIFCSGCGGELVMSSITPFVTHTCSGIIFLGYCMSCGLENYLPVSVKNKLDEQWFNSIGITTKGGKSEKEK